MDDPGDTEALSDSLATLQTEEAPGDSLFLKIAGNTGQLKVTGALAAGVLKLKAPSENLTKLLGKADSTAVDMCKDFSFWHSDGSGSLSIYSLCDNDLDMRKSIQLIRVRGYPFVTGQGISEQSSYADIRKIYPGIQPAGKFVKDGQTIFVADDIQKGIAFELTDTTAGGRCLAVLAHLPGKAATTTTIPLYPGLVSFQP